MIGAGQHIPFFHVPPASINAVVGVLTGDITDIQTWQDGNILQLAEVAATPGQDLEITFANVTDFRRIGLSMYYEGSLSHWIEVQLWNVVEAVWEIVWTFSNGLGLNYRYSDIPKLFTEFIDGSGNVKMRICHPTAGNAAHDSFIDYATLIR